MVHYGAVLEKAVRNSNLSISSLAKKLDVNRRSIYYWFERKRLDPLVMERIGRIINVDFSTYLTTAISNSTTPHYQQSNVINEDVDHWKIKYTRLLHRYNETLSEMRRSAS